MSNVPMGQPNKTFHFANDFGCCHCLVSCCCKEDGYRRCSIFANDPNNQDVMKRTSRYCNSFFKLFRNVILVITITIVITFCRICRSGNITKGGVSEPLRFLSLNAPMSFSATTSSKIIIFHFTFRCYKRRTLQRSYMNHNSTCCKYVLIQAHLLLLQIDEVTGEKL